jgi:CubicO group peptidase (beta-lactamase class C family)
MRMPKRCIRLLSLSAFLTLAACGGSGETAPDYDFAAVDTAVEEFLAGAGADLEGAGLIIVHRDWGVVYQESFGSFDKDRVYLVASSSKMVTAGILNRLHDDGLLDLDAPVADVVEWGEVHPEITPAQLISNSSGLVGLGPDPTYGPYLCQYFHTGSLSQCGEQIFTAEAADPLLAPPDTEFRYGGGQWQVAGAVAEAASGMSWAELVDSTYVEPCGLEGFGYNNHFVQLEAGATPFSYPGGFDGDISRLEPSDNPSMEGGLYTTTGAYGELLLMHLRGGRCGENFVLSQESVERMQVDRIAAEYDGDAGGNQGYGMGWWVDRSRTGWVVDPGAYGSFPWIDNERGYAAFSVIEDTSPLGSVLATAVLDEIEEAIDNAN